MPSSADLAAWAGALGTWAALGAAVHGARTAFHMIRVERDRDREQERRRQADQASSVAVWVGRPFGGGNRPDRLATSVALRRESFFPDIYLVNGSRLPVYEVGVFVWVDFSARPIRWQNRVILPPTHEPMLASAFVEAAPDVAPVMEHVVGVSVAFRDAEGTHWQRTRDGSLREIDTDDVHQRTGVADGDGFVQPQELEDVHIPGRQA
ncbi:hypothetical protein SAMN04490357_3309 [Streptomyces misionensis]|uniref:Uncharacterized protein n=1 Tax=Streptomyces misionensis TaxID=67331 RepID=A0A1H4WKD8_9ACTN|nr:hypothetical protein [Streptomyces misionensis]SEC93756.1 hypothetical protein SAMN04490357_3309 [Streptomyces misionensis]